MDAREIMLTNEAELVPCQATAAFAIPQHLPENIAPRSFPTGWGQHDTHAITRKDGTPNPSEDAGKAYSVITPPQIVAMVRNPPAPVEKERAQWFIPSRYADHDARSHEAQRERGAFSWLALDIDQNNLSLAEVKQALADVVGECSALIYSTSSATEDNRKWRALVPLKNDLPGADYPDTAEAFFDLLEAATEGILICDRALQRPGQLIYLPNPRSGFYQSEVVQSDRLNLHRAHPIMVQRQKNRDKRETAKKEAQERQAQRRKQAPIDVGHNSSPVDAFNAAHDVEGLLDRYGYARSGRSNDWRSPMQTSGSFATTCFGDYWVSLSASDAVANLGQASKSGARFGDAFDLFCHFEHGGDFSKAVAAYGEELRGFSWSSSSVRRVEANSAVSVPPNSEGVLPDASQAPPEGTGTQFILGRKGRPIWCAENACMVLETDPAWQAVLAQDEFAGMTLLLKPIPGTTVPRASFTPRPLADTDITTAVRWFNRNGFPDATKNTTADALYAVAAQSIISPVRHYLEALVWDSVPRVGDWLTRYCEAEETNFTRKVGQAWLISAVARALQPGCKADCALVLEGRQGQGKSSAIKALAGETWFHDGLHDLHSKDASAGLRGKWIIELPELSAMRRSDTEAVKAFLSRTEERYRPAYARAEVIEPRRCVFAGTTNRSDYLTDDTGGRRFWPVVVGAVRLADLSRDRDQIWAEAVTLFRAGEKWWLDRDTETEAAAVVAVRAADDPWSADVLSLAEGLSEVSSRDIFQRMDIPSERQNRADAMRIVGILTRAGWTRSGKFTAGPNRDLSRYLPPEFRP